MPSGAGRTVTRRDDTASCVPLHDSGDVELGGHSAGGPLGCAHTEPAEQRPHPSVDLGAVVDGQHAGHLNHEQRVLFRAGTRR